MTHDPHDDAVLGKAYDARMVRRLLEYVAPQGRLIAASIALMLLVMAAQLAQPYIIKLLIDEHIVRGRLRGLSTRWNARARMSSSP